MTGTLSRASWRAKRSPSLSPQKNKTSKLFKKLKNNFAVSIFNRNFAPAFEKQTGDPLAQLVEHNTFNVGVLGSSPKRITKKNPQEVEFQRLVDFVLSFMRHICTTQTYNKALQITLNTKKRLINTCYTFVTLTIML